MIVNFFGFHVPIGAPVPSEDARRACALHAAIEPGACAAAADASNWLCGAGAGAAPGDPGLIAVVAGEPRWRDPALAGIAHEHGSGAACAAGYARYGAELPARIGGRFALAVVDRGRGRVFLAQDRIGQSRLYYRVTSNAVVFATSPKALNAYPSMHPTLSLQGLYDYMYFHMVPSPGSIWEGTGRVEGGHYVDIVDGQINARRYWLPRFATDQANDPEQLAAELRSTLSESVRRACEGEDATGAFLSGGLDSSSVAGMLAQHRPDTTHTFSIGFPVESFNELQYARIAAEHFGTIQHEHEVTPENTIEAIGAIAAAYDEPFGNSSALPVYFCAKLAREHGIARLLAGDGGDEIFGGNTRYVKQFVFEAYWKIPALVRRSLIEPLALGVPALARVPVVRKGVSYIRQARIPLPDRLDTYNFLRRTDIGEIFSDEFLRSIEPERSIATLRETYMAPEGAGTLDRMLFLDWKRTLQDNDLVKVNRMCELAGVDVAYPMLDDDLVALACRIPPGLKIRRGRLRDFYKRAMRDFLPEQILRKSKHGFGLPFGIWTKSHPKLQELAYGAVLDLRRTHYFRPSFLENAIEQHRTEEAASYYGELIWILMMLRLWLDSTRREPGIR